jgi:hypothetical protein
MSQSKKIKSRDPKITFRIIRACNFDCPGCSTFSHLNRKGTVRLTDFKKAIDTLSLSNFEGILNISGGEPTFHKDLAELIRYASQRLPDSRIAVFTNGDWIGIPGWQQKLKMLFSGPNVLIRFSLDRQHAEGAMLVRNEYVTAQKLETIEIERKQKAILFQEAMLLNGSEPGKNFDFAFKGTIDEARKYMAGMGTVPVYLISLRPDPENRPKLYGFMAIDVQENNEILVYPTLGHIPLKEPLGGLETLEKALELNRNFIKEMVFIDEQHQWT